MRNILLNNTVDYFDIIKSISISVVYFVLGVIIFYSSYLGAKQRGTLINMGEWFKMNERINEIKKLESSPKVIKNLYNKEEIEEFLKLYKDLPTTVHNKK